MNSDKPGPATFVTKTQGVAAVVVIALSLCLPAPLPAAPAPERTLLAAPPRVLTDFELTSHEGEPTRLSKFRGAPVLVFFGFAHCPSVCPAALQELRLLENEHKAQLGRARIVVVSVDGERDTPQVMAAWLRPFSKNFIGLTGAPKKVREIAREFSAAFYKTPGKSADEYLVEHNAQIFLIDAEGRLRATFFNAPVPTIAQVTQSVRIDVTRPR